MRIALVLMITVLIDGMGTVNGATIFETGTLGPTGISAFDISEGNPPGVNVSQSVFTGVRFHIDKPVVTERIGGHFAGPYSESDTFFGAIVALAGANDFPDSHDLTTQDVLGATLLRFSDPSTDVYGELTLQLDPGWYALIFGSGLFGSEGHGAVVLNSQDFGDPDYIGWVEGAGWGHGNGRTGQYYVVTGEIVPEPKAIHYMLSVLLISLATFHRSKSRSIR